jgi:hypothetical protein
MHETQLRKVSRTSGMALGLVACVIPRVVSAQAPAPERPAAAEAAAAPSASAQAQAPTSPTAPSAASPPADTAPEIPPGTAPRGPVPPAFPPAIPNLDYGGRVRTAVLVQNANDREKLDDVSVTAAADFYFHGQVHKVLKWSASFTLEYGGAVGAPSTVSPSLLDAVARFEPIPEFSIWMGRMLVMADRYAPSGPWSMDEWFYPGFYPGLAGPPVLPKSGPVGRDVGATVWGAPFGGHLKYYLGAYQLQDPNLSPLYSGRLQLSLLSTEPGWGHRTTYYGDRELISIGVGGQFQNNGSVLPPAMMGAAPLTDDYSEYNADLIVEKKLGEAGTLSIEGAYYGFVGDYQRFENQWLAAAGFTFPTVVGIGKFRPSVRYQRAAPNEQPGGPALSDSWVLDAQLSYLIMHWYARASLGYRLGEVDVTGAPVKSNMIVFGVQLWDP